MIERIVLFFSLLLLVGTGLIAQRSHSHGGIRHTHELETPKHELTHHFKHEKSAWLDAYQRGEIATARTNETLLMPLRIHIVGNSQGEGYTDFDDLLAALKAMNVDFESAGIQFYIDGEIDFINNSTYYDHTFPQGSQMMAFNNDPGVINTYIVGNPADACGYFTPSRDAIALANDCLGADDFTWSHEMGHFLSLPHTFAGWEGVSEDEIDLPVGEPAPDFVGGVEVDLADGSNCATASDGFCDTYPDYIAFRFACNFAGFYADSLQDPTGQNFANASWNIMGYALDGCVDSFSNQQRDAMVTNVMFERANLISDVPFEDEMADASSVDLLFPEDGYEGVLTDDFTIDFEWSEGDNADFYVLQISRNVFFASLEAEFYVTGTSFQVNGDEIGLELDRRYFWRVRPVNRFNVMSEYTSNNDFEITGIVSDVTDPELNAAVRISPNPIVGGQNDLSIRAAGLSSNEPMQMELYAPTGQLIRANDNLRPVAGTLDESVSLANVANGIYFLRLRSGDRILTRRVVVNR